MDAHPLKLMVQSLAAETAFVRSLLFGVEGGAAPHWQAGAHIRVSLPGGGRPAVFIDGLAGSEGGRSGARCAA